MPIASNDPGQAGANTANEVTWQSEEVNKSLYSNPILVLIGSGDKITTLTISAFPQREEWFLWTNNSPIMIQDDKFSYKLPSSNGNNKNLVLQGIFGSAASCNGTIYFPKGFFWNVFTISNDLTVTWTAHQNQ